MRSDKYNINFPLQRLSHSRKSLKNKFPTYFPYWVTCLDNFGICFTKNSTFIHPSVGEGLHGHAPYEQRYSLQ